MTVSFSLGGLKVDEPIRKPRATGARVQLEVSRGGGPWVRTGFHRAGPDFECFTGDLTEAEAAAIDSGVYFGHAEGEVSGPGGLTAEGRAPLRWRLSC
jgi:hypothetical protein